MNNSFTDDNGSSQSFGLEAESTIDLTSFDQADKLFVNVTFNGVTEKYEINTTADGGPLLRPRRPR
jgi:hypothetical protein